ncbi:cardiolipin synthase A/B [Phycisphaerales bacterium]|nr:cardiolipin synthase A/B [Phycisphaerales bacterium]
MPLDGMTISITGALFIVDAMVRVALIVRVILRRAPASVALTWLVVLFLLPFLSLFLYALVGEPRLGFRRAERYQRGTRRIEEEAVLFWAKSGLVWEPDASPYAALARLGTAACGLPPLKGNQVEILGTGAPVLRRIIEDIDNAKDHCHLLYYIWQPTGTGQQVADALIRAAQRGVACRVLVDAVGAQGFVRSPECARMRAGGVRLEEALPVNPLRMLLARVDLRNHRKIAVIDSEVAYCGSQNMTDETFRWRRRHRKTGPWIDATVRIKGPAVQALQSVFLRDWLVDSEEELADEKRYFANSNAPLADGCPVHVLPSGPGPQAEAMHQVMLGMLFAAKREIILTTPYFIPDEATKSALTNAALRGVEVTLVLPDVLDARLVAAAARSHYEDLLDAGVKIVHHMEGLLHAKTITIDGHVGMVTTANFDVRSFWLNFESSVMVYDEAFVKQLRFMQRHYMNEGEAVTLGEWKRRPLYRRFADNCAKLLSPLL